MRRGACLQIYYYFDKFITKVCSVSLIMKSKYGTITFCIITESELSAAFIDTSSHLCCRVQSYAGLQFKIFSCSYLQHCSSISTSCDHRFDLIKIVGAEIEWNARRSFCFLHFLDWTALQAPWVFIQLQVSILLMLRTKFMRCSEQCCQML